MPEGDFMKEKLRIEEERERVSDSSQVAGSGFNYVDIKTQGCEGWLNLFFGEYCINCVNDIKIADEMRKVIPMRPNTPVMPSVPRSVSTGG